MIARFLDQTKPLRALPLGLTYLLTTLIVLTFVGVRMSIGNIDESVNLPLFLLFVPAVFLSSLLFGKGSGIFATCLCGGIGMFYFIEPVGLMKYYNIGEFVRFIAFMFIGLFTAIIVDTLNRTIDKLGDVNNELIKSNRHRDLLLQDINHRVKNHLSALSAVFSLGKRKVEDKVALEVLDAAMLRLSVLAQAYTRLHVVNEDVTLDAKEYLQGLCDELSPSLLASRPITIKTELEGMQLDAQSAVSLGLIANELISNAIKYAFPDGRNGTITLSLRCCDQSCVFEVADDGIGESDEKPQPGLGTRLIASLVAQLEGTISRDSEAGMRVCITLPRATDNGRSSSNPAVSVNP